MAFSCNDIVLKDSGLNKTGTYFLSLNVKSEDNHSSGFQPRGLLVVTV